MEKAACRVRTLANDGFCAVEFCPGCQVFHLKLGYTTLHINPEAFLALGATIAAAVARYQRQRQASGDVVQARSEGVLH